MTNHIGEIAALLTAVCWTGTSMAFENVGKRVGAMAVNLLRLGIAFLLYCLIFLLTGRPVFPSDATIHQWIWLGLSAIVGFVIGDFFLLKAFISVGARISMLIMSLAPPIAALLGWWLLDEHMSLLKITGMIITIIGVAMVILQKKATTNKVPIKKFAFSYSKLGLLFAFVGASGQAIGLVLSKYGMEDYNAFAASQIRVLVGFVGFGLINMFVKNHQNLKRAFTDKIAFRSLLIGTVFGPVLGVSLSLLAIQNTQTGVASTIMSIVPVLIIPASIVINKEKVSLKEILGALVAVGGVSILFL